MADSATAWVDMMALVALAIIGGLIIALLVDVGQVRLEQRRRRARISRAVREQQRDEVLRRLSR